jgi:hypothetical protein
MRWMVRGNAAIGALAVLMAARALPVAAQGITTAAVQGRVVDETGQPVAGATMTLVNASTGQRFIGVSRADGRYDIENVAVGGPYTLGARLIGYQAAERAGFTLALGQKLQLNLTMNRAAVQLEALTVTAEEQDPLTAVSRTGTAGTVTDSAVSRLPTLNRNFTDFVATVPQVGIIQGDAPSVGGGHNRMNNIQIDGVSDNDLFGLGSTGQPGGQVSAKSISLEAVKEYQVLIAPFDIRQSGFQGGMLNAITKRGTNDWHGSAFWYYQQDALVRDSLPYTNALFGEYLQHQRGFSLGGPILRNKLHFFGAAEWQTRETPSVGPTIGRETLTDVNVARDSAQRLVDILQNQYGIDAGSFEPLTIETPNKNFFGRLDYQLSDDHVLTLRHNYSKASDDLGISRSAGSYELSSAGYIIDNESNSTVLQLNSTLGGGKYYNELRLGYLRIRDARDPLVPWAQVEVENRSDIEGTSVFNEFISGAERFSQRNRLNQDEWQLTDDLTFFRGAHTLTVGTDNRFMGFDNTFFHTSTGQWQFSSLADLEAANPRSYFVQVPYPGVTTQENAGRADWRLLQLGGYVQDQWDVTRGLQVTLGVRLDVPITLDSIKQNPDLAGSAELTARNAGTAIRTDVKPSGNLHWSPRLGLNWDLTGNRATVVRGGAGLFTGRPAFVWLSNAYTNTGRDVASVFCGTAGNIPAFTSQSIVDAPQDCPVTSALTIPRAQVNYFDEDFKFPQELKATLALDQRLPGGVVGTLEFLYTKGINTIYQQEMNIAATAIRTNAEGRQLFGDPTDFSTSTGIRPTQVDSDFLYVLRHTNRSEDRSYNFTAQLQKRFGAGYEFTAAYNYQNNKDLTSLGSSIASSNFGYSPVSAGENPNEKSLTTSRFDIPHRIVLSGTFDVPIPSIPTSLTVLYVGQSGSPYSWTIDGDANGDGFEAPENSGRHNDMAYVPNASASNYTASSATELEQYQALIDNPLVPDLMPCLKEMSDAGGGILERNGCRNPWSNRLDVSFRMGVGRAIGPTVHRLTLVGEVFNFLNLMNGDWGVSRGVSFFETRTLLRMTAYDATNDRGTYEYVGPNALGPVQAYENGDINPETGAAWTQAEAADAIKRNVISANDIFSRWRIQLGLRYDF